MTFRDYIPNTHNEGIFIVKQSSDLLRGNIDMLLLSLIYEFGSAHGYQLIKEVNKRSHGFFHLKEGTIYPALHHMENDGLLQGSWQATSNGPQRRCYVITKKGCEVFSHRKADWLNFTKAMNLVFELE
jgi:DNA-binding PadR family transcriptional regulator